MVRFSGRPLKGDEIRAIQRDLSADGNRREFFKAVQRGDSTASLNKILKQSGYTLSANQARQFIGSTYAGSTTLSYVEKYNSRFGHRNSWLQESLQKQGYSGDVTITLRGQDKHGNTVYRTVSMSAEEYDSLTQFTDDILDDIEENKSDSLDFQGDPTVVKVTLH